MSSYDVTKPQWVKDQSVSNLVAFPQCYDYVEGVKVDSSLTD